MRTRSVAWTLTTLLPLVALAACGTPPTDPTAPGRPATTASPRPTATPTPTPTVDQTALQPGTNHSIGAAAYTYRARDVHDWLHGAKDRSPTYPQQKVAFLTFDDGPTSSTPHVLDALKAAGVHASFYVIAGPQGLEKADPAILRRTVAEGHSVCIHTYSHSYKTLYPGGRASADAIVADYDKAVAAVKKVLGDDYAVHCHRYPGGHGWKGMDAADRALEAKQSYWLDWNSENGDGTDSAPSSGEGRAARALSTLGSGPNVAVVLMHDYTGSQITVDGIAPLVRGLKEKGYTFGVTD